MKVKLILINFNSERRKMESIAVNDTYMTNAEAADFLGLSLNAWAIYRYRNPGKIKTYKIGRRNYYRKEDLLKLFEEE